MSELKLRIRDQPTTRRAIQNGQIVNKGHFARRRILRARLLFSDYLLKGKFFILFCL